jgi:arylsulfatase A-like enzyme
LFIPKRKLTKMVAGDADPPHANLLVILTDQQRFDTIRKVQEELGFPSKSRIRTPNLDRLIAQGVHFRNAYTHCPVCVSARTSFMSGRTIENTGVRGNGDEWESSDVADDDDDESSSSADKDGDHWKIKEIRTYDTILVEDFGYVAEYYGKCESNQYTI